MSALHPRCTLLLAVLSSNCMVSISRCATGAHLLPTLPKVSLSLRYLKVRSECVEVSSEFQIL
jgi:hypothetical protein